MGVTPAGTRTAFIDLIGGWLSACGLAFGADAASSVRAVGRRPAWLCIAVLATACTASSPSGGAPSATAPSRGNSVPTSAGPATSGPPSSGSASGQRIGPGAVRISLIDPVGTSEGLYGLEPVGDGPPYQGFRLARVDPLTLTVRRSAVIPGDPGGVSADAGTVYVAARRTPAVLRFRVGSLTRLAPWRDPVARLLGPLAITRFGLWVADAAGVTRLLGDNQQGGHSIERWTGTPLMQTTYDDQNLISNGFWVVAPDPAGCPTLYFATGPSGLEGHPAPVLHPAACELGFTALAAGARVAWISSPTGSLAVTHLVTSNATTGGWTATEGPSGSNQITPSVAGSISFLSDPQGLACYDGRGQLLARTTVRADGPVSIVQARGREFVVIDQGNIGTAVGPRVQPFTPAHACR